MAARRVRWAALLAASFAGAAVLAQSGTDAGELRVRQFLESVHTLRAAFGQVQYDESGNLLEESTGTVSLERPGRFRWTYELPYERIIVADGGRVWMFDPELEQVVVRQLGAGLGNTPAALLTGQLDVLENFSVEAVTEDDGLVWVRMAPVDQASDFKGIGLGFDGDVLRQLELADRLGQRTRVSFTNVEMNPELPAGEFVLDIPDGADVFDESAG